MKGFKNRINRFLLQDKIIHHMKGDIPYDPRYSFERLKILFRNILIKKMLSQLYKKLMRQTKKKKYQQS